MLRYVVRSFRRSDGRVTVTIPDVPIAVGHGLSDLEALRRARQALRAALKRYIEAGFELPKARSQGSRTIRVFV